jgi:nitric oxide reductase large subunit
MNCFRIVLIAGVLFSAGSAFAQEMTADTMQALMAKVKADKKLVVSSNMNLTDAEAKGFWPVYESYQKDLAGINQRMAKLIASYADAYNSNTLDDAKAKTMVNEAVSIESAEAALKKSYIPKLEKVLPMKKVAVYYQIENKIRALVRYELADQIPLAK